MNERIVTAPRGALSLLARRDPALGRLFRRIGPFRIETGEPGGEFAALLRSVVYQQLSGKAAGTIHQRVLALFGGVAPSPEALAAASPESLRAAGLSSQKVSYVRDLADKVISGALSPARFSPLSDEEVIAQISTVRGFGRWSAEMFLLFHLGRLDVWPVDDFGVKKAVGLLHGHDELPRRLLMQSTGDLYRPYRSIATWYLWRSLDAPAA